MKMRVLIRLVVFSVFCVLPFASFAQTGGVVLNGAFINLTNGTSTRPIYFVVDQSSTSGIVRNSGHIISEGQYNYVSWNASTTTGSFVIPFGYSTTTYLPLTFNKTTATSSVLNFSTWGTASNNTPYAGVSNNGAVPAVSNMNSSWGGSPEISVIDRWWDIHTTAATTANVTFSYRGEENTLTTGATGQIDGQHWNGTEWETPISGSGTGVTTGVGTTTINGANDFSPWILVARSAPLPVHLTDLKTQCTNNGVKITWKTRSEQNSDQFFIERSTDGENFKIVSSLQAAGNSNTSLDYEFEDKTGPSEAYYRIRERDFDGKEMSTQIMKVYCPLAAESLKVYGNDFRELIVSSNLSNEGNISLQMYDVAGRLIMLNSFNASQGQSQHSVQVDVPMGIYLVVIECSGIRQATKIALN